MHIPGYDQWKTTLPEDRDYIEDDRSRGIRRRNAENHRIAESKEEEDEII